MRTWQSSSEHKLWKLEKNKLRKTAREAMELHHSQWRSVDSFFLRHPISQVNSDVLQVSAYVTTWVLNRPLWERSVSLLSVFLLQTLELSWSTLRVTSKMNLESKLWTVCSRHFWHSEEKNTTKILDFFNKDFYYITRVLDTYLREEQLHTKYVA